MSRATKRQLAESQTEPLPLDTEITEEKRIPLAWASAAASWIGLLRAENQDSAFTSSRLVAVADGMGGEAAGDLASMMAARRLWLATEQPSASTDQLAQIVADTNADIADLALEFPLLTGMGTTICGASFDGQNLHVVHIGDSRAYRWRDGQLKQLTHDHSLVQRLIDQGQLTPEEARLHPKRSLVLRIVNGSSVSRPDQFSFQPLIGDRYLFCSDGLSSYISAEAMIGALGLPDIHQAVDQLLQETEAAGAPDNVTIVLTEIVAAEKTSEIVPACFYGAAVDLVPPADGLDDDSSIVDQLAAWGVPVVEEPTRRTQIINFDDLVDDEPEPILEKRPPRRRWLRFVIGMVALLLLVEGLLGCRAWLQSQYFLGEVDGKVAVYSGLPYLFFSAVEEESTIAVADLPFYYAEQVLAGSIRPTSLIEARLSLDQLAAQAQICIDARQTPTVIVEGCP